jgi:hypothetical protein
MVGTEVGKVSADGMVVGDIDGIDDGVERENGTTAAIDGVEDGIKATGTTASVGDEDGAEEEVEDGFEVGATALLIT